MPSIKEVIAAAQLNAESVFEEREYLTTFGSTGEKDPWDDAQVNKGDWVSKIIDTIKSQIPLYSVS